MWDPRDGTLGMRGTREELGDRTRGARNQVKWPVGLLGHLRSHPEHRVGRVASDAHAKCGVKAIVNLPRGLEM